MATENLTKTGLPQIIATDTDKYANGALKRQGWVVDEVNPANTPTSGRPI